MANTSWYVSPEGLDAGERSIVEALHEEARRVVAHTSEQTPAACPACGAEDWVRDGFATRRRGEPVQVYRCRTCGKKRVGRSDSPFRHPLFPPEAMVLAVLLKRAGWTLKRIAACLGVDDDSGQRRSPNRQTVGRWVKRLAAVVADAEGAEPPEPAASARPAATADRVAEVPTPPLEPPVKELIGGRFEVLETLTGGSQAGVFVVHDRWRGGGADRLALKVLANDAGEIGELGREFLLRTRLRHPNVAGVRDFGVLPDGRHWFTQELVEGDDLFVASRGASFERLLEWMVGVLRGCAYLHGRGIVHRDLKPENILMGADGAPRIVDFGLSVRPAEREASGPGGSLGYLAPEVLSGAPPAPTVDLYAVAVTFYHVLVRELPQPNRPLAPVAERRQDVPAWFDALLAQLTDPDPARRPPSAGQVIDAIVQSSGIRFAQETPDTLDDRIRGGEMVGREADLATLDELLAADSAAHGVLVTGGAGIGKTRLLDSWRQQRQLTGGEVVAGQVGTVLRAIVARLGADHPLVVHHADVVRRLSGEAGAKERPPPLQTRDGILRDRDAVLQLIAAGHPRESIVLVDDLDTADEPTRAVLDAILGRTPAGPKLLLAVRSVAGDPLLERWIAARFVRELELRPLPAESVAAVIAEAFDRSPIAEALARRIQPATEGNPRFVEEVLRGLVEQGAVSRDADGAWEIAAPDALPVPRLLVDACRARLATLGDAELRALRHLAVATGPVPRAAAAAIAGEHALIEVARRALVRELGAGPGERVQIAHDGLREAALAELEHDRLRAIRRVMADAVEAALPTVAERPVELLARLLLDSDRPVRALGYLESAAGRARERFEVDQALSWLGELDQLLAHPRLDPADVPGGLREQVLRDLVHMLRFRGRYEEQSVVLDRLSLIAQTQQNNALLFEGAALKALTWFDRGRFDLARQICAGHLPTARDLGDRRAVGRFLWLLAMVSRATGSLDEGLGLSQESLEILGEETDPEALELRVQNHNNRGIAFGQQGNLERAVSSLERALSLCQRHELVSSAIVFTMNLGICYAMQCRYGRALAHFDRARSQAERLGWRELGETLAVNQAVVERNLGLGKVACERLEPLVESFDPTRTDPTVLTACCTLASCRAAGGDLKGAVALIEHAVTLSRRAPTALGGRLWLTEAEVRLAEGTDEARTRAVRALESVVAGPSGPHEAALAGARLAAIALEQGELDAAREHSEAAAARWAEGPLSVREGLLESQHVRARVLLALGQRAEALQVLERACDELARQADGLTGDSLEAFNRIALHQEIAGDAERLLGRTLERRQVPADAQLEVQVGELRDVLRIARQLVKVPTLGGVVEAVLDGSIQHGGMEKAFLLVHEKGRFVAIGGRRAGRTPLDASQARPDEALLDAMVRERRPVDEHDARMAPDGGAKPTLGFCRLALPLTWGEQLVGAILLESNRPVSPPDAHRRLLLESLAGQAAMGLAHHLQVDEIERLRRRAVSDLTRTRARLAEEAARREQAERVVEAERRVSKLRYRYDQIIHGAGAMREVLSQVDRVVDPKINVLIYGESGTGKELIARAIHYNGPRRDGPFVAINCGAIPANLIESELFGHVKGAFTGAVRSRRGHFELAHKGTLFLDEVGEVSPDVQVRLLRVLETSDVKPVGGDRSVQVDVRIVAATNRDLKAEVKAGRFREDLYYRLATMTIPLPPLRERLEDLPLLVEYFTRAVGEERGEPPVRFGPSMMQRFSGHSWPGNVRELRNVVEYASLFAEGGEVPADLSLPL